MKAGITQKKLQTSSSSALVFFKVRARQGERKFKQILETVSLKKLEKAGKKPDFMPSYDFWIKLTNC